jgi:Flp pilus assembly protein TadG
MRARCGTQWRSQRGQTMALVAISMVSLLAMAALAIDVVTLYVARGQAERGADAAALAAAKVLADSGVTTDPTNASPDNIWKNACNLATQEATVVAGQNLIAGQSASVNVTFPNAPSTDCSGTPTASSTFGTDPQVTVSLSAAGLPTFFARIWSKATNSVTASATAEAYNPSNSFKVNPNAPPAVPNAPRCVKPLLLPNCDPRQSSHGGSGCNTGTYDTFIDSYAGSITNPGDQSASPSGVIGETFVLSPNCDPGCSVPTVTPGSPPQVSYYPVTLPNGPGWVCPGNCSLALPSADYFENDLACCNSNSLQCGQTGPVVYSSSTIQTEAADAGQCLIHETVQNYQPNCQTTLEQDCLDVATSGPPPLLAMRAGASNPLIGKATGAGVAAGDIISTSDSMVSLPIYDSSTGTYPSSNPTIIGYLQVFIGHVDNAGNVTVTVLNIAGCGTSTSPGATAISGAGPTIPVNLIHN